MDDGGLRYGQILLTDVRSGFRSSVWYAALVNWLLAEGSINLQRVWDEIAVNGLSLMAWLDVLITAVVVLVFIKHEGRRLHVSNLLAPIAGTYLVGPSFGLPLFLFLCHRAMSQSDSGSL